MRLLALVTAVVAYAFISTNVSHAQYLKIEGIKGEATDAAHRDWIDLLSVSQSVTRSTGQTGQARRRGGASLSDLSVSKEVDAATPMLMRAAASGQVFPSIEIELAAAGTRKGYLKYHLENVMVTSVSHEVDKTETREEVAFNYEKIRFEYTASSGEAVTFSYDVRAGRSN